MNNKDRISVIIVDDEPLARKKVEVFCQKSGFIDVLQSFQNPVEALEFMRKNKVDIVFLDIRMGEMSGFDFIDNLDTKPAIIITSAYEEYALKGFEYEVGDYLLKPFSYERFLKGVEKVKNLTHNDSSVNHLSNYISIKSEHRIEKINIDSILYVEGMRDYLRIHTLEKKIMTLMNFTSLDTLLPSEKFIRIHKSYMVAIDKISIIGKDSVSIDNTLLPIGRSYKKEFLNRVIK